MKVLIDLNIFIDVLQKRQEFLKASLQIVKQALTGIADGVPTRPFGLALR